jgi:hypothetical protein
VVDDERIVLKLLIRAILLKLLLKLQEILLIALIKWSDCVMDEFVRDLDHLDILLMQILDYLPIDPLVVCCHKLTLVNKLRNLVP